MMHDLLMVSLGFIGGALVSYPMWEAFYKVTGRRGRG
jgi:hypothetical protein